MGGDDDDEDDEEEEEADKKDFCLRRGPPGLRTPGRRGASALLPWQKKKKREREKEKER